MINVRISFSYSHRMKAHGDGQVCQDWHKDVGSGCVAAEVGDDHSEPSEDEASHPSREGGKVQP